MKRKILCLFDVDGTLTLPRKPIEPQTKAVLENLKKHVFIGLVGGSDLKKICEQMGGERILSDYDYVFPENGLVAYKNGQLIGEKSILTFLSEDQIQTFINFCLKYLSIIKLPVKRGNFIEFRTGLINISPVGRGCNQQERDEFEEYDKVHRIREKFVRALRTEFKNLGLCYSVGGQISFDCFPVGWDKTFCLGLLENENFEEIHFFGDKTFRGGNDYEIFNDKRTIGHSVSSPAETRQELEKLFKPA